jgi:hypothetical protein
MVTIEDEHLFIKEFCRKRCYILNLDFYPYILFYDVWSIRRNKDGLNHKLEKDYDKYAFDIVWKNNRR